MFIDIRMGLRDVNGAGKRANQEAMSMLRGQLQ